MSNDVCKINPQAFEKAIAGLGLSETGVLIRAVFKELVGDRLTVSLDNEDEIVALTAKGLVEVRGGLVHYVGPSFIRAAVED